MTRPHPNNHRAIYFTRKRFETVVEIGDETVELQVETPDLTTASVQTWGDWGPMHRCTLRGDQAVTIQYRTAGTSAVYRFNPAHISINSPAQYEVRKRTPFYLEVVDADRGFELQAFMDREGVVRDVKVKPRPTSQNLTRLAFRDAELERIFERRTA
jgi:hypothetical protein